MKNKIIISTLVAVAFVFVFGRLAWADNYRYGYRHYYYGDKPRHKYNSKPQRHYPKTYYHKPGPKNCPRYYGRHYPPRANIHIYKKYPPVYKPYYRYDYHRKYPFYPYRYYPYPPFYGGTGFYFGTTIFDPGIFMNFSTRGR